MKLLGLLVICVLSLCAVALIAGQLGWLAGKIPLNLGVHDGRLLPPSPTPNSVSSQAELYPGHPQQAYAQVAPFTFTGDGLMAMQRLAKLLLGSERTILVTQEPRYLYARCQTPWLKFTDDLEFALDEKAGVIHVRSASRLGQKDFGQNRQRVQALRAQFDR